jgi:hypothetical protein
VLSRVEVGQIRLLDKRTRDQKLIDFPLQIFFVFKQDRATQLTAPRGQYNNMADNTVVKKEEESFALRFWRDLVAGTAGGVAQTLSGHPLDTLKVRLQTMPTPAPGEAPMVSQLHPKKIGYYGTRSPAGFVIF